MFRKFIYTPESGYAAEEKLPFHALLTCGAISGAFCSLILTPIELIKCKMQVQAVSAAEASSSASVQGLKAALPSSGRAYTTAALSAGAYESAAARPRYAGPVALISEVVRVYGVRGLWHGQMGTFLRETGGGAVWFGAYEYVSLAFRKMGGTAGRDGVVVPKEGNTAGEMMVAGACGESFTFIHDLEMMSLAN